MSIYFKKEYINAAEILVQETKELEDVCKDLRRIDDAISKLGLNYDTENARRLDEELRRKYSTINIMLNVAQAMPKFTKIQVKNYSPCDICEVECLKQDRYGILCHVIMKKGITSTVEDCIEYVTED